MHASCSSTKGKRIKARQSNLGDGVTVFHANQQAQHSIPLPLSYSKLLIINIYL